MILFHWKLNDDGSSLIIPVFDRIQISLLHSQHRRELSIHFDDISLVIPMAISSTLCTFYLTYVIYVLHLLHFVLRDPSVTVHDVKPHGVPGPLQLKRMHHSARIYSYYPWELYSQIVYYFLFLISILPLIIMVVHRIFYHVNPH